MHLYASVAQSVEQGTENPRVIGSIPIGGTSERCSDAPICGRSSSGRAPPCQGGGSEFEPRRPLQHEAIVCAEMHDDGFFVSGNVDSIRLGPYTEIIVQQTEAGRACLRVFRPQGPARLCALRRSGFHEHCTLPERSVCPHHSVHSAL